MNPEVALILAGLATFGVAALFAAMLGRHGGDE